MQDISIIAQLLKKKPSHDYGTIYIRGYYNRRAVASKSTGHQVKEDHWDMNMKQVISRAPNASLINTCILTKIQDMQAQLMKKQIMGANLNKNQVKKAIQGKNDSADFISFCRDRIKIDYESPETRRTYLGECSKMEEFQASIAFADLNYEWLASYKRWLIDERRNDSNTLWKSFKFINTMIRKAIKIGGLIEENPFATFDRGKYEQKVKAGLEMSDCGKIVPFCTDPDQPVILRRVAMYFLLMCYSGMRFKDAMRFDPALHVKGGRFMMTYHKFNTAVNFAMHDRLQWIIDLIRDNRLKLSNKDFNVWLKVLGPLAGINVDITTHKGRHSLGGFLAEMEIPEEQAQRILGHKDIRSTRVYYHLKNKTIDRSIQKLNELK